MILYFGFAAVHLLQFSNPEVVLLYFKTNLIFLFRLIDIIRQFEFYKNVSYMIHQNLMPNVSYMIHAIKSHRRYKIIKY